MLPRPAPLLVLMALAGAAPPALAQPAGQSVPTREGNRWGGQEHEPNPGAVPEGSATVQRRETDELERIDKQLQDKVRQDAKNGSSSMGGAGAGGGGGGQQ